MKFPWTRAIGVAVMGIFIAFSAQASPQAVPAPPAAQEPAAATPTADQVLDRYVNAIGGRAAWTKLNSRISKGTIEIPSMNNLSGSVEIHEKAPNSMLAVITLAGAVFEQGFDGTTAWSDDPQNGLRVLSGAELEDARREADFYHPLDLKKLYTKMTVSGLEKVGDRDAYVVQASNGNGDPDKMYFDAESWLLVRAVNHRNTPDGVKVFQAEVGDYKVVDGVKLPFTVHQSSAESAFTIHFTEIQHNLELADGQFAKPAAK
jgi:photosynthetic reaction center cytochrome c subunit